MTFYIMANRHPVSATSTLDQAKKSLKKYQDIWMMLGGDPNVKWYILETIEKQ